MRFFFILICVYYKVHFQNVENTVTENPELFKKSESLLKKYNAALKFFEQDSLNVNLDGLFGLRISQGIFSQISNTLIDLKQSNEKLNRMVSSINKSIASLSIRIAENVKRTSPYYYTEFESLVSSPFILQDDISINLNESLESQTKTKHVLTRLSALSDICLSLLVNRKNSPNNCTINDECIAYLTENSSSGYYLTHQVFYLIISKSIGCLPNLMQKVIKYVSRNYTDDLAMTVFYNLTDETTSQQKQNIDELFSYYCSKIYKETEVIYANFRNYEEFLLDLFFEQIVFCGLIGFEDFLNEDYFKLISQFQQSNGCFGEYRNTIYQIKLLDINGYLTQLNASAIKKRVKRADSIMKNNCSSHETGLGLSFYSLIMRKYLKNFIKLENRIDNSH